MNFNDSRIVTRLRIEDAYSVNFFHGEIYILNDIGTFSASAERTDRNGHTYQDAKKNKNDIDRHGVFTYLYIMMLLYLRISILPY